MSEYKLAQRAQLLDKAVLHLCAVRTQAIVLARERVDADQPLACTPIEQGVLLTERSQPVVTLRYLRLKLVESV